jgi:hypothetical protein
MDELRHPGQSPDYADQAVVRVVRFGDQPQQRRLAHAVGADEGHALAIRDFEGHLVEQCPATGEGIADLDKLDESHAVSVRGAR